MSEYPQTTRFINEMNKELTALRAENERLRKLVAAVKAYEFRGIECDDVAGVNWFDARDAALAGRSDDA